MDTVRPGRGEGRRLEVCDQGSVFAFSPGSHIRNTEWLYGVVIYTGEDTRIQKNAAPPGFKRPHIEKDINTYLFISFFVVFLTILISVMSKWSVQVRELGETFRTVYQLAVLPRPWELVASRRDGVEVVGASEKARSFLFEALLLLLTTRWWPTPWRTFVCRPRQGDLCGTTKFFSKREVSFTR